MGFPPANLNANMMIMFYAGINFSYANYTVVHLRQRDLLGKIFVPLPSALLPRLWVLPRTLIRIMLGLFQVNNFVYSTEFQTKRR